jgi:predicted outer membrane repeat protein
MTRRWYMTFLSACALGAGALGCGRMDFDERAGAQAPELKLAYPRPGTYHALLNETLLQIAPMAEGVKAFAVSPPLPTGLSFDEGTGEITGIAIEAKDRTRYEVTGTGADDGRSVSAAFYLTALPGWKVTATSDWADDNNGGGTCYATMAGGCTLRAAVQTASEAARQSGGKRMILLQTNTYEAGFINGIEGELVIAGAGVQATLLRKADPLFEHQLMHIPSGRAVRLENLSIQQFGPDSGGVARVEGGRLEVFHAELSQNSAIGTGGAIYVDSGGQALLENVTFQGNKAVMNNGKGGVLGASGAGSRITVVKSTAVENEAKLGSFAWIDSGATVELINSTITGNVATESSAVRVDGGSLVVKSSTIFANTTTGTGSAGFDLGMVDAKVTLANTIVAANTDAVGAQRNCATLTSNASALISLGGNLFSNDADGCKDLVASRPHELNATLDLDTEARDNGGFTRTVKIGKTSAAIDRGVGECPAEDQRGVLRELGACDVGAYEWRD